MRIAQTFSLRVIVKEIKYVKYLIVPIAYIVGAIIIIISPFIIKYKKLSMKHFELWEQGKSGCYFSVTLCCSVIFSIPKFWVYKSTILLFGNLL